MIKFGDAPFARGCLEFIVECKVGFMVVIRHSWKFGIVIVMMDYDS